MVSVLILDGGRSLSFGRVKSNTIRSVYAASPLIKAHSIKESEQFQNFDSESGPCFSVKRHVYPLTIVSVS